MDGEIPKSGSSGPPPIGPSHSQKSTEESFSVKPGNHDRGWNDPPVFAVDQNIGGKPVPTKLNKRVPFPLSCASGNSGGEISNSLSSMSPPLPPPTANNILYIPNSAPVPVSSTPLQQYDSGMVVSKETVMKILTVTFESISFEPRVKEEVQKRMDIFESSWDLFSDEIKIRIGNLSKRIEEENYKVADQLLRSLGSDFVTQCSPWIMAIKNIVRGKQEQKDS